MGCAESKTVSKKPGTSVVTDDTHIDEYNENVSDNRFIDSGNKTHENGLVTNNNDEMANRYSGYNKPSTIKTNGYTNKHTISTNNQRNQHITVISSNKPGYEKRNIKPSSNTQNITNLVDIEEYEDFSKEKPITSTIIVSDTISENNNKPESKTTVQESVHSPKTTVQGSARSPKTNSDLFPKVIAPAKGVKRQTKPNSTNTTHITGVVDLEDYDYSDNQTVNSVSSSSDDGHEMKKNNSDAKISDQGRVLNNNITKDYSKSSVKVPNNSITVIPSTKSLYGAQKTKKTASSTTESITNLVDLEEYD